MTDQPANEKTVDDAVSVFRNVADSTDELTRARLQSARRSAVDAMPARQSPFRWQTAVPGTALAACLVVGVMTLTPLFQNAGDPQTALPVMPLIAEDDLAVVQDLELLEELAFVAYLSELDLDDGQVL